MKYIKKLGLWLVLALAIAGCNLNLTNDTIPECKIILDNEYIQISVTENISNDSSRATFFTEDQWAYSKTTVIFNGNYYSTDIYSKNSSIYIECKKEGTYNFFTVGYKRDMETPVARSEIISKDVKFSEAKFNLEIYLSHIYTYEGSEGEVSTSWCKTELSNLWFRQQSIVPEKDVKSIKLAAYTTSVPDYTLSWSGGENVTVFYNEKDGSITIACPNKKIFAPADSAWLFGKFENALSIDIDILDTSNVTSMESFFYNCSSLTSINLSNFDTSNVINMSSLFDGCRSLTDIDLSNFNTSNVTFMSNMFHNCASLRNLDLSNFDTSNVNYMAGVFEACTLLTNLNISNFNTSNVETMTYMFASCSSLTSLNLWNFNTSNVKYMSYMFSGCSSLTSINLNSFDTSNVTAINSMFYACTSLKHIDLSNFDTSKVTNMARMFYCCSSLISPNLSSFNTLRVTDMTRMFAKCSSLTNLNLSNFYTSKVKNLEYMFNACTELTTLNLSNFDTSYIIAGNLDGIFGDCPKLSTLITTNSKLLNEFNNKQ